MMKHCIIKITMATCVALVCSCQKKTIEIDDPGSRSNKYFETPLWSIAIAFPDDYDWMKDNLAGNVNTRILVFKDDCMTMSIPASKYGPICPEADFNTIIDGHLYSQCPSDLGLTMLSVDGNVVFVFKGRETMDDIVVKNGDIYSLGQPVGSEGWSFRKNGELLLGQDNGKPISGLYEDEGELCFAWGTPVISSSGQTAWRYYTYFGGTRRQMATHSDITAVHCIRRHNGKTNYLASSNVIGGVLWEDDLGSISIELSGGSLYEAAFLVIGGELCARILTREDRNGLILWHESYWNKQGIIAKTEDCMHTCSACKDSPELIFASSPVNEINNVKLWKNGTEYVLPPQYFMVSPFCVCSNEKYHYLGLNDGSNDKKTPLLIFRGDTARFTFNGYFTELSLP